MSDMMTFPDTWEEYEKSYGFTDNEEVYTNGARLIPSFRVKQWLDHMPSAQSELANNSPKLDKENGELISRQAVIDAIGKKQGSVFEKDAEIDTAILYVYSECKAIIKDLPSVQPRKGKWIDYSDEGYVECPFCHSATNCYGDKDELYYCFSCGAELRGEQDG